MGSTEHRTDGGQGAASAAQRDPERLADTMASLLKSCGIYPPTHPRVIERAEAFGREVELWIEPPNWLAVRIRGDTIAVQRTTLNTKNPLVAWMLGRFREAGLAGLEFGPRLDAATAIEFARALAGCSARSGRTFSAIWPPNHAHVRPLDLVFSGKHGESEDYAGEQDAAGHGAVGTASQDAWKLDIVARLARSDDVANRLRAIEATTAQLAAPSAGQSTASLDLISSIVDLLPVEIAADRERVDGVVQAVLDELHLHVTRVLREGREVTDADLIRAALNVAKKYFGKSAGDVVVNKELPTGRPEDERITADLALLLGEVAALPSSAAIKLPTAAQCEADAPALAAELCNIYLYVLKESDRPETLAALSVSLPKVLTALGERALPILDQYLRVDRSAFTEPLGDQVRVRILTLLERAGHGQTLRDRGYCDAELLMRTFPDSLPLFARLLRDSEAGIDDMRRAVTRLGNAAVAAGAERLRASGVLTDPAVVAAVLAIGGPTVAPLMRCMLAADRSDIRASVVGYLRSLELPAAEAAALRFIEPVTEVPIRYLEDLCRIACDQTAGDARTRQQSSLLLRAFVLDARRRIDRRAAAVGGLRYLPGPETRATLRRLATVGRFTQLGSGARALRRQARAVLQFLADKDMA